MLRQLFHRERAPSAQHARERLKIILAHERCFRNQSDFLPRMQQDILEVIKRYMPVDLEHVKVQLENQDELSVLEINVTMPEEVLGVTTS